MQSGNADVLLDSKFVQGSRPRLMTQTLRQKKNRKWVHELQNVSMALQVTYLSSHTALRNILHLILFLTLPPLLRFLTSLRQ